MTYNINIPQPNDLLSVSQSDLLNNFTALVTGDTSYTPEVVNLEDRTAGAIVPTDPVATADMVRIYSKQDSLGNTQLYATGKDATATTWIKPLTTTASGINIAASAWVDSDGSVTAQAFNLPNAAHPNPGEYNFTFTDPLTNANYVAIACLYGSAGEIYVRSQTINGFSVRIRTSSGGLGMDSQFSVIVFGEIA